MDSNAVPSEEGRRTSVNVIADAFASTTLNVTITSVPAGAAPGVGGTVIATIRTLFPAADSVGSGRNVAVGR